MSTSAPAGRPLAWPELAAALGGLWAAVLGATVAVRAGGPPWAPGELALALATCLAVGALHAGALGLALAAARRVRPPRLAAAVDLGLAVALAALYGALALSLVKFASTGAQLRFSDLWFLARSAGQVIGEGTAAERRALALAALLPPLLAVVLHRALRRARRGRAGRLRGAALLAASGLAALALVAALSAGARRLLLTAVPETAWTARALSLGPARGGEGYRPDPALSSRIAPFAPGDAAARWNLLVVMLESIPWQRLLGDSARPETTPHLLALAAQSVSFDRAYATSTHSDYAQTSVLASLHPRKAADHDYFTDLAYPRALPWDVLAPLGWRSAVVSTQNERWGNMIAFLSSPRLGLMRHAPDFPAAPRRGSGAETKIFEETAVAAFLSWLDEAPGERFVAYLNFQATHYPYVWPESFTPPYGAAPIDFPTTFLAYPRAQIPRMLDRFHNALAYVDAELGRLVAALAERGLWERTLVVVVSDHGEAFYEHGLPTHGTALHEEQIRVPLLLRAPGQAPRRVAEAVSVLDALPTAYRLLGLPRHGALQGRDDVLAADYRAAARALPLTIQGLTHEDGVVLGDWKWIVNLDRRDFALFDLARDPEERRNLARDEAAARARLDGALAELLERQLGYYRARGWEAGWYPPRLP